MQRLATYLSGGDEFVGPFYDRQDAEWFLMMMTVFGADCEGMDILQFAVDSENERRDAALLQHNFRFAEASFERIAARVGMAWHGTLRN